MLCSTQPFGSELKSFYERVALEMNAVCKKYKIINDTRTNYWRINHGMLNLSFAKMKPRDFRSTRIHKPNKEIFFYLFFVA